MTSSVERVRRGHFRIHTEMVIAAPAETVWNTLLDPAGLDAWSSSLLRFDGEFALGNVITVTLKAMGFTRRLDHKLIEYEAGHRFAWSDPFLLGMRDKHRFVVEAMGVDECRFLNTDEVSGGLAWLIGGPTARSTMGIYDQFNDDLRIEAERRHAHQ